MDSSDTALENDAAQEEELEGEPHDVVEERLIEQMTTYLRDCDIDSFARWARWMLGVDLLWKTRDRIVVQPVSGEYRGCFGDIGDAVELPRIDLNDREMRNKFFVGECLVVRDGEETVKPFTVVAPHRGAAMERAVKAAREYYGAPDSPDDLEPMRDGGFNFDKDGITTRVSIRSLDMYPTMIHAADAMFRKWMLRDIEFLRVPVMEVNDAGDERVVATASIPTESV